MCCAVSLNVYLTFLFSSHSLLVDGGVTSPALHPLSSCNACTCDSHTECFQEDVSICSVMRQDENVDSAHYYKGKSKTMKKRHENTPIVHNARCSFVFCRHTPPLYFWFGFYRSTDNQVCFTTAIVGGSWTSTAVRYAIDVNRSQPAIPSRHDVGHRVGLVSPGGVHASAVEHPADKYTPQPHSKQQKHHSPNSPPLGSTYIHLHHQQFSIKQSAQDRSVAYYTAEKENSAAGAKKSPHRLLCILLGNRKSRI